MADLGRPEDALAASEEAAALHRELAAILPVFRESVARSLTSIWDSAHQRKDFDAASHSIPRGIEVRWGAVRTLVFDLRDRGRGEQEIAGELDSYLSADDD